MSFHLAFVRTDPKPQSQNPRWRRELQVRRHFGPLLLCILTRRSLVSRLRRASQSQLCIWPQAGLRQSASSVRLEPHCTGGPRCGRGKKILCRARLSTSGYQNFFRVLKGTKKFVGFSIEHWPVLNTLLSNVRLHVVSNARRILAFFPSDDNVMYCPS